MEQQQEPQEPCKQSSRSISSPSNAGDNTRQRTADQQSDNKQINLPESWNHGDAVLAKPEDLSPQVLNPLILKLNASSNQKVPLVKELNVIGRIAAILSQVVELVVEYDAVHVEPGVDEPKEPSSSPSELWLPTNLVVKFFKPSITLTQDMFRVEGNFYQNMALPCNGYPFRIPRALHCSPTCIILEKVVGIQTYSLLESCPTNRLYQVVDHLAQFHAYHWKDSSALSLPSAYQWPFPNLSPTAGMGASLPGPDKARYFMENYSDFCKHLRGQQMLDISEASLEALGQRLCSKVLDIHESVYGFTPTLIHGDFHVGNMLFTRGFVKDNNYDNDPLDKSPIWLLDWATCGKGNPLCDFVFFWVVSTKDSDAQTFLHQFLPLYYNKLMKCRRRGHHEIQAEVSGYEPISDFSYEDCLQMVRTCLVHQFILLVCYDAWTRNFLLDLYNTEGDNATLEFYEQHFDNVNRRCALAVFSAEVDVFQHMFPPDNDAA